MPHKQFSPEQAHELLAKTEKINTHPWFTEHVAEPLVRHYWRISGEHSHIWISADDKEKIPETPFVAAINHSHNDDSPAIKTLFKGREIMVPGALYLFENPVRRRVYTWMGSIALARKNDDVTGDFDNWDDVKARLVSHLDAGNPMFIFHEGTRNPTLEKAGMGAADIAIDAGVPIVPMALGGTHVKGSDLAFTVGEPITWRAEYGENRNPKRAAISGMTREINEQMPDLFTGAYQLIANKTGENVEDILPR